MELYLLHNGILGVQALVFEIIISQCFLLGCRQPQFLKAGSEISIVLGRSLEIQVALREHVQHQLLGCT